MIRVMKDQVESWPIERHTGCMTQRMVSFRSSAELLQQLDELVSEGVFGSRSEGLVAGLEMVIDRERRRAVGAAIERGYREHPLSDTELQQAEANARALVAAEPW
ncbi:MAG: Arc/MetJ-type ribon-helix-helix transcriptional regulator [Candidatus Poriferisodalaceae bacterium]|jgi:Arc/MetJ-type ribon-helix-helix transcriptional regulator